MQTTLDLLKFRDPYAPLRFNDGLVAAIHPSDNTIVITSPNSTKIFETPLGSARDLVRRHDGFYADDDYCQWPQPWNDKYSHLCAIPVNPRDNSKSRYSEDDIMWYPISDFDVNFVEGIKHLSTPCTLLTRIVNDLQRAKQRLHIRFSNFRTSFASKQGVLKLADIYLSIIDVCFLALDVPRPIRDVRTAVAEIQRAWLSCIALFDFMETYNPRMSNPQPFQGDTSTIIGASTDNSDTARDLFKAGIPLYFTRHVQDLGTANILSTIAPMHSRHRLCHRDANPPYQMIYMGPAHTDAKFDAILHHARACFSEGGVFTKGIHYREQYKSSWRLGMPLSNDGNNISLPSTLGPLRTSTSLRNHRSASMVANTRHRQNLGKQLCYPPPTSPYSPTPVPLWVSQVNAIDDKHTHRKNKGASPCRSFIVPPIHLIIKPDGSLRQHLMAQWLFFRPAWFRRCSGNVPFVEPLPITTWKELLSFAVHSHPWDENETPNTKTGVARQAAWQSLKYTVDNFQPDDSVHKNEYICKNIHLPDSRILRGDLWQLTEINFRYEVTFLDNRCDTSTPKPEAFTRYSEYQISLTVHANHRKRLIDNVFNRSALFDVTEADANSGLASAITRHRLQHTHALWVLMTTWQAEKPLTWNLGDQGLTTATTETLQWEKSVILFFLQNGYNILGYAPSLPHHL